MRVFPSPIRAMAQTLPTWRSGQAVGEWREIASTLSTRAALVPTNIAKKTDGSSAIAGGTGARTDAWCGLSIDTRSSTVWAAANGGHGDYSGNEVICLNLSADIPEWVEWCPGSSGNVVRFTEAPGDSALSRYTDGMPCSSHSYYGQQFIERHNRAIRIGGSIAVYGSGYQDVEAFDIAQRTQAGWDALGTYGAVGGTQGYGNGAIGFSVCKDPRDECVYVTGAVGKTRKLTPAGVGPGGTWSDFATQPVSLNSGAEAATAIDTTRNRCLWIGGFTASNPKQPYFLDLATATWSIQTYAASAEKANVEELKIAPGMIYDQVTDKFLLKPREGGKVIVVDPVTLACTQLATTNSASVPEGFILGAGGPNEEEGVYNRWLLAPALGGAVFVPKGAANVWFLRLY